MLVASELTTVGLYFNEKWQAELIRVFSVTLDTKVRGLRIVDTPASSYQFEEQRVIIDTTSVETGSTETESYVVNITWHWFSADGNKSSRIRLDYHADEDILYILTQAHRGNPRTVYDVIKSPPPDDSSSTQRQ